MSASRTLSRQNKTFRLNRERGTAPGTPLKHQLWEVRDGDLLRSYHATKGHRCVRQSA